MSDNEATADSENGIDLYDAAFEQGGLGQEPALPADSEKVALQQQVKEKNSLLEKFRRNFYSLLVTARAEMDRLKTAVEELKAEMCGPFRCPHCKKLIDRGDEQRVEPAYTKVLKSQLVVELKFRNYEDLTKWIMQHGLTRNTDNLPTLPEALQAELSRRERPTLASTGSAVLRARPDSSSKQRRQR